MGNRNYRVPDRERGDRFVRLIQIVEVLRTQRLTLNQMATEFGVDQRTIRRDLVVIKRAGALVEITRARTVTADGGNPFIYRARLEVQ